MGEVRGAHYVALPRESTTERKKNKNKEYSLYRHTGRQGQTYYPPRQIERRRVTPPVAHIYLPPAQAQTQGHTTYSGTANKRSGTHWDTGIDL